MEAMNVSQLRDIVRNNKLNIRGYSRMSKADLINAIKIHQHLTGSGLLDMFRSPRKKFNNTSTQTLKQFANESIKSMTIMRAPIQRMVDKAMNVISLGAFKRFKEQSRYDSLFHLGLIVTLSSGAKIIIEKNAVININQKFTIERGAQFQDVPMTHPSTLKQLIDNTLNAIGPDNFFLYDGLRRNCQDFLLAILKSNRYDTPATTDFIKQDLSQLSKNLSPITKRIMNGITNLGARWDAAIGNGKYR